MNPRYCIVLPFCLNLVKTCQSQTKKYMERKKKKKVVLFLTPESAILESGLATEYRVH